MLSLYLVTSNYYFDNIGAVVGLQNSTYDGEEGEEVIVCIEFLSIDGGLRRPVSVSWVIVNGTAECEACTLYAFIIGTLTIS